jgi:hypothetical protein
MSTDETPKEKDHSKEKRVPPKRVVWPQFVNRDPQFTYQECVVHETRGGK